MTWLAVAAMILSALMVGFVMLVLFHRRTAARWNDWFERHTWS
jgi:hypothetical protein